MRLKFWRWAHDASERLWHLIYYNRLPEGIAQKKKTSGFISGHITWHNSKGEEVKPKG